jgi:preprotein translocase subunit SecD
MLCISRWKAAAMLLTVFLVSLMAIPSLLPEKMFRELPAWAQRRVVLGIEFQGGSRQVLAVDVAYIRKEKAEQLRDEVRKILRAAKVGLVSAPVVRGDSVEVRIRDSDLARALAIFYDQFVAYRYAAGASVSPNSARDISDVASLSADSSFTLNGPEVVIESFGNLIRLAVTETAISERVHGGRQAAIGIIKRRIQELGATGASIEPRGADRVEVVMPGVDLTRRLYWH